MQVFGTGGIARALFFLKRGVDLLRNRNRISGSLLLIVALSIFIPGYTKVQREAGNPFDAGRRSDFGDYYNAAILLSKGEDPYRIDRIRSLQRDHDLSDLGSPERMKDLQAELSGVGSYLYPPFTAFLLIPLTLLSYETASVLFQSLSFLALVVFFVFFYNKRGSEVSKNDFLAACVLAALVVYAFLLGNATNGNVLFFLLLLTGTGLALSFEKRALLTIVGGVLLGLAAVIKITPLFFGLVLFAFRRWLSIAGVFAGVLFALAIPSVFTGWEENLALLDGWKTLILDSYGRYGIVRAWANNQSISGMIGKLFLPGSDMDQIAYGLPLIGGIPSPDRVRFYAGFVRSFNLMIVVAASVTAVRAALKSARIDDPRAMMRSPEVASMILIAALASLLTAGVSWYHAYGILLLPAFLRVSQAFGGQALRAGEMWSAFGVSLFGFFDILFTSEMRTGLALYSVFTLIAFAIFCLSVYSMNRREHGI